MKLINFLFISFIFVIIISQFVISASIEDIESKIKELRYNEREGNINNAIDNLKFIAKGNAELCLFEPAINSVEYLQEIYEYNFRENEISDLWEELGDIALQSRCQGSWQFASSIYYKGTQYLLSKDEILKEKEYNQKIISKMKEYFENSQSPYSKAQIAKELIKFESIENNKENISKYINSIKEQEKNTNFMDDERIFYYDISICKDKECTPYNINKLGRNVYVKFITKIGDKDINSKVSGYITTPTGEKIKYEENPYYLKNVKEGEYYVTTIFENEYGKNNKTFSFYLRKNEGFFYGIGEPTKVIKIFIKNSNNNGYWLSILLIIGMIIYWLKIRRKIQKN